MIPAKDNANTLITKCLVAASCCSIVDIGGFIKVVWASLRSNAKRRFTVFIVPVLRVLAVVSVAVFAPR